MPSLPTAPSPLLRALILAAALVVATGCMQIDNTLTVRPDGSGTIKERVVMSSQMSMMVESMAAMDSSADASAPMFSEEDIRERDAYPGTELESVTMIDDLSGTGYESVYAFADVRDVTFRPASPEDVMPENASSGRTVDIDASGPGMLQAFGMTFTPGAPAELVVQIPQDATEDATPEDKDMNGSVENRAMANRDTEADFSDPQQMRMLRMMFRDARFRVALNVDGEIVETNARHHDGSTVTLFDLNFGEMVQDTSALRRFMEVSNKENAGPSDIEVRPGVKVEDQEQVTIRFE